MKSIICTATLFLCAATMAPAAPVPETRAFQPTIVARIRPLDGLLSDAKFVAAFISRAAPNGEIGKQFIGSVDQALESAFGPDWRKAIDTGRPSFAYGFIPEKIEASNGVVLIPVRDEAAFLALVGRLAGKVEKLADGAHRFEWPGGHSPFGVATAGFVRVRDGYAFVTAGDAAQIAADRIPKPAQIMAEEKGALASVRVFVDRIPKRYRDQALGGIAEFKAMLQGESGPKAGGGAVRTMGISELLLGSPMIQLYPLLEPVISDAEVATLNLTFDRPTLDLSYDLIVRAKPGSKLETLTAAMKPLKSRFASLVGPDAAASLSARMTIPEDLRKAWSAKLAEALNSPPPDAVGQAVVEFSKSLIPTLQAGDVDLAFALMPAAKAPGYTMAGGVQVGNGKAIETAFRDMIRKFPKDVADMFKLDASKLEGISVHHISFPPAELGPAKIIFGDGPIRLTFRPDSVLAAFGPEADALLQQGVTAGEAPASGMRLGASARRLAPLVKAIDERAGQVFDKLRGPDVNKLTIMEVRIDGGKDLRIHHNLNGLLFGAAMFGVSFHSAAAAPVAIPAPAPPNPIRP